MRLAGEMRLEAPRSHVWSALADPEALGRGLPGVEDVGLDSDGTVRAQATPRTGLGATGFDLTLRITDRREPEHATITGHGRGGESDMTFRIDLDLHDDGAASVVAWNGSVTVRGVLASVAQRVLPSIAADQIESVLRAAAATPTASRRNPQL